MRRILLVFIIFLFNDFASAATSYEITVEIQDNNSTLEFPSFQLSSGTKGGTSMVENCTYSGKLTTQEGTSLLLEGKVACISDQGESYYDTPAFILNSEGGEASMELGEEAQTWKYSVEIKVLNAS